LQDPNEPVDEFGTLEPLLVLKLTDRAVATSGGYRRFALIDGKKYSHIINPTTGTSAEDLVSVTIIAEKAIDADALATAVSVMGKEKGLALIEKQPYTESIILRECVNELNREDVNEYTNKYINISTKYQLIKTSGADKYIK
jgi:thiamine biosynthesis lipoprotein ApbE